MDAAKVISVILTMIIMLLPFVLVGWALYYMRVHIKIKRSRQGFMNGSRNDFYNAVRSYEKHFSITTDTSTQSFKEWKRKYGYLKEFLNFNHTKLGLDKDYTKTVNAYVKYYESVED